MKTKQEEKKKRKVNGVTRCHAVFYVTWLWRIAGFVENAGLWQSDAKMTSLILEWFFRERKSRQTSRSSAWLPSHQHPSLGGQLFLVPWAFVFFVTERPWLLVLSHLCCCFIKLEAFHNNKHRTILPIHPQKTPRGPLCGGNDERSTWLNLVLPL